MKPVVPEGVKAAALPAIWMIPVPFFRHTLISDIGYSAVFFGLHSLLSRTVVRSERVAATA